MKKFLQYTGAVTWIIIIIAILVEIDDDDETVALFAQDEIPWDQLSFPMIRYSLEFFYEDRKNNHYRLHTGDIMRGNSGREFLTGPKTRY